MQPEYMISVADKNKGKELLHPSQFLMITKGSGAKNKDEITVNLIKRQMKLGSCIHLKEDVLCWLNYYFKMCILKHFAWAS